MASIVSAGTTSATALNMSADTTGILQLASNNGTVGLTLSTSQYIGIGTASPTRLLTITGAGAAYPSASNPSVRLDNTASGRFAIIECASDQNLYITNGDADVGNIIFRRGSGSGSESLRISPTGNLLLGVTSDSGLTAGGDFALKNGASIRFRNAADSAYLNMINVDSSNNLNFGIGGVPARITFGISGVGEVSRFDTSGNLLIGTSSGTGGKLQITSDSTRMLSNGNGTYRVFNQILQKASNTTSACAITFASQGSAHTSHIVEIFFAAAQDDANGGVGGTATYILGSLTGVGTLSEIQDLGTGVSFAGSVSGSVLTVTATMTSNRNVVAWTVKVTSTYSVGAPTSISVT
jgi:hypothetical protein